MVSAKQVLRAVDWIGYDYLWTRSLRRLARLPKSTSRVKGRVTKTDASETVNDVVFGIRGEPIAIQPNVGGEDRSETEGSGHPSGNPARRNASASAARRAGGYGTGR